MSIAKGNLINWGFVCLVISLCILPFLRLCEFVQPQFDDYSVWMVMQKFGVLDAQVVWYQSWTGRYTAHFLMSILHPIVYGRPELIGIIAFIIQLAFPISLLYSIRRLISNKTQRLSLLSILSCVLLVYYWQIPSPAEAFFWIPSTFSYQLGIILLLVFFGILWNSDSFYTKNEIKTMAILAILIPGTCEIALIILATGIGVTALLQIIENRKPNRVVILLLIIASIFSLISILAPGNSIRSTMIKEIEGSRPGDIIFTIQCSIGFIKSNLLDLLVRSPFLPISILFTLFVKYQPYKRPIKISNLRLILIILTWIGVYFTLHLPFIFKAGIDYLPGRLQNVTQFYFISGWFIVLYILTVKTYQTDNFNGEHLKMVIALCSMYLLFQMIMPNKIQSAITDWRTGKASNYKTQLYKRHKQMSKMKGMDVLVAPVENIPYTIFIADLTADSLNERNRLFSSFYDLKSVKVDSSKLMH
jgi:hypothetical protein